MPPWHSNWDKWDYNCELRLYQKWGCSQADMIDSGQGMSRIIWFSLCSHEEIICSVVIPIFPLNIASYHLVNQGFGWPLWVQRNCYQDLTLFLPFTLSMHKTKENNFELFAPFIWAISCLARNILLENCTHHVGISPWKKVGINKLKRRCTCCHFCWLNTFCNHTNVCAMLEPILQFQAKNHLKS